MTPNRRIFLNVVATYGRSLYALVVGLFCGRWTLMALGHSDYGLMAVVGGMLGFVGFVNGLMASAVGRFFAYSVGESMSNPGDPDGLEKTRQWFSVAVFLHMVLSMALIVVGYPVGTYAIRSWLTIPPDRVAACIWVWRFSCLSCFIGMASVPYSAMYTAKQEIAELTVYSFMTTTLNAGVLYYMVSHPSVWLVKYALWTCALSIVPVIVISARAFVKYEECRIVPRYFRDVAKIRELVVYSACRFGSAAAMLLSNQGCVLLVNKLLGPARNAAMSVGNSVTTHACTLSASLNGAFYPALTNLAGAKKYDEMRTMAMRICRLSSVALLVFVLPVMLESREILRLWLRNPPEGADLLCVCLIVVAILQRMTEGHWMSVFAVGRIGRFQLWEGVSYVLAFICAWLFMARGADILGVGYGLIVSNLAVTGVKLYFGRTVCGLGILPWVRKILVPIAVMIAGGVFIGLLIRTFAGPSALRVCMTTLACEAFLFPIAWLFLFDAGERDFVASGVRRFVAGGNGR